MTNTILVNKDNKIKSPYQKKLNLIKIENFKDDEIYIKEETYKSYLLLKKKLQEKNIEIDYTFDIKTNIEDKNTLNKYDIALLEYEENSNDRGKLYNKIRMLCDEKFDDLVLEDNIYDLYKFIPLMFINENVALSDRVDNLEFDGNGVIDLSRL